MASFKVFLVLAALLLAIVSAHPVEYTIHSINVINDDDVAVPGDGISVTDADVDVLTTDRAPQEKAVFAVEKVDSGFARTTKVGLTVQKGTSGTIKFRIRARAVTIEQLNLKSQLFSKSLSKSQKKVLRKLSENYEGGLDIPWLEYLGINLSKKITIDDLEKVRSNILNYDRLSVVAEALLKETIAQTIEIEGTLTAHGVSFIPTTVFSFLKIAKVQFMDGSKMLVLSDHPGDVVAATVDGSTVVPSDSDSIHII